MKISPHPPSVSYWEIKEFLQGIDLLIIGSGIVGLTTAIFYKQSHPNQKVIVLEKGWLPSGASTKNAGFACFGSVTELLADLKTSSEDHVYNLVGQRMSGLAALQSLLGSENIGFDSCGGFEIFRSEDNTLFDSCVSHLDVLNQNLHDRFGLRNTYAISDELIKKNGFEEVDHIIKNQYEGSIDTGRMMFSLIHKAQSLGIQILNGLDVRGIVQLNSCAEVHLENELTIRASNIHVATNGFAKKLLPELDVRPARAQVLITSEIKDLKLKGTFHMNEGFYYFRNIDNRVLLGGGRQLSFEEETSTELTTTELIQENLDRLLKEFILPSTNYEIEHRWAGVMGVGITKETFVKRISENISCAVRLGGMGVAIGTNIGKRSAALIG